MDRDGEDSMTQCSEVNVWIPESELPSYSVVISTLKQQSREEGKALCVHRQVRYECRVCIEITGVFVRQAIRRKAMKGGRR